MKRRAFFIWVIGLFLLGLSRADSPSPRPTAISAITALAFRSDGQTLLTGRARRLEIRDPVQGRLVESLVCPLPKITAVVPHPNGHSIAIGGGIPGQRGEVHLLDWATREWKVVLTNSSDVVTGLAWNPAGTRLAVVSADHGATVWRWEATNDSAHSPQSLVGHSSTILAVASAPDGAAWLTGGGDRTLRMWAPNDGQLIRTLAQHSDEVTALSFRPFPQSAESSRSVHCASASTDGTLRVWQPSVGRLIRTVRPSGANSALLAVAYAPDGKALYAAGREGRVWSIDPDSDRVRAVWPGLGDWIYALAVSPDSQRIAVGDAAGRVQLFHRDDLQPPGR